MRDHPRALPILAGPTIFKMQDPQSIEKQARQTGTTPIELSVVIAVLLLLVGVLSIGITAWKSGANRPACIVNLSSLFV
jgi:hypothetical protein